MLFIKRWNDLFGVLRIEETGHLWCKFLDEYSHFEDWLKAAELTGANPNSSDVLYTCAKEELKKFEVRQFVLLSLFFNNIHFWGELDRVFN